MAARQIADLEERKRELIAESTLLREDFALQLIEIQPTVNVLEKGYDMARAAGSIWNFTSPLRQTKSKKWALPQMLFRFCRNRFF